MKTYSYLIHYTIGDYHGRRTITLDHPMGIKDIRKLEKEEDHRIMILGFYLLNDDKNENKTTSQIT